MDKVFDRQKQVDRAVTNIVNIANYLREINTPRELGNGLEALHELEVKALEVYLWATRRTDKFIKLG